MENHSNVTGWQELFFLIQILLIFGCRCNRYFWDIGLKFIGDLILIWSFSTCKHNFSKANCFRVYRKMITWSTDAKGLFLRLRAVRNCVKVGSSSLLDERALFLACFLPGVFTLYESFAWQTLTSLGLFPFARIACLLQLRIETNDLEYSIWATPK